MGLVQINSQEECFTEALRLGGLTQALSIEADFLRFGGTTLQTQASTPPAIKNYHHRLMAVRSNHTQNVQPLYIAGPFPNAVLTHFKKYLKLKIEIQGRQRIKKKKKSHWTFFFPGENLIRFAKKEILLWHFY